MDKFVLNCCNYFIHMPSWHSSSLWVLVMDKIKILAAVLALAGCMDNGFGMQENIEINNGNVILRSADTSEWNRPIAKRYK